MNRTPSTLVRRALLALSVLTVLASCAIQPDAAPREVPEEDRGSFGTEATGAEAAGSSIIYLLAPNEPGAPQLLRSAMRDVSSDVSAVVRTLLDGPNPTELEDGADTAIPPELTINSVTTPSRVSIIDIGDALDELDAVDLRYAVAQIVHTVTAVDGVDAVQIRVNGENRPWPRGDGELTTDALRPYDYPGLVESTQPAYPTIPSGVSLTTE